jgi:GlpG protein
MRLIGHLPNENSAAKFSDFLFLQGITNLVEAESDGWAVWIYSEDELQKAKDFLKAYVGNPLEARFQKATRQARELVERKAPVQEATPEVPLQTRTLLLGMGPVTLLLALASVALFVLMKSGFESDSMRRLLMSDYRATLPEIMRGEVWRLFTPILLHGGLVHLAFNVLCLIDLGGLIERRQGSRRFTLLVLALAAISNLVQYYVAGPNFFGLSGVLFGLLGYIWIRGRVDPRSGLFLQPQIIAIMLVWFFLCFTPLPFMMSGSHIANGAHAGGLVAGMLFGYVSGLRKLARE